MALGVLTGLSLVLFIVSEVVSLMFKESSNYGNQTIIDAETERIDLDP